MLTTVLNIDQRTNERSSVCFDSDSSSVVCDNSANVHTCNRQEDFEDILTSVHSHKYATIGGRGHAPSGATQLISPRGNFPCYSFCFYWESMSSYRGDINVSVPSDRKLSSDFSFLTFEKVTFSLLVFQKINFLNFDFLIQQSTITK